MKVFLDTNVCLSAFFGHGLCTELLDYLLLEQRHHILVSAPVIAEFQRIATDKFRVPYDEVVAVRAFLDDFLVSDKPAPLPGDFPDPDDAPIIGAALAAGADLFITGDKALLALDTVENLPIRSPRDAYILLRDLPH